MASKPDKDDDLLVETVTDPDTDGDPAENIDEIGEPFPGNNA